MAYNHGREDRKWYIWKEAEEKLLRECGAALMKQPPRKSVQTTGQTLTLTEGFTVGQAILENILRVWWTGVHYKSFC